MARTIHTRRPSRPTMKRRRGPMRRRRFVKRRRSVFTTNTRSLNPTNAFRMRARKLRKSAYRSMLWRSSLLDTHYRSIRTLTAALPTVASNTQWAVGAFPCFDLTNGNEFWKNAGGLEDNNWATGVPWQVTPGPDPESITLRGGRIWMSVTAQGGSDDVNIRARVQLIFLKAALRSNDDSTTSNTASSWLTTVTAAPHAHGWSLQDAPDYANYFYRPVLDKTFLLRPGSDCQDIYFKLKPTKIDTGDFKRAGGPWFPIWVVYRGGTGVGAIADNLTAQYGHNISFAVGGISS